jgi:DNA-binding NtrC family response regulator
MDRIGIAAQSEASVAVIGESPEENLRFARRLHDGGARRDGPFLVLPCGTLAHVMLASELRAVGSEVDARDAWFLAASGGTLVLDAIEALPIPAQLNLVRVLDDPHMMARRSVVRGALGVRVVTTSTRALSEHVARGALLESLLYRIGSIVLRVPDATPFLETGS